MKNKNREREKCHLVCQITKQKFEFIFFYLRLDHIFGSIIYRIKFNKFNCSPFPLAL